MVFITIIINGEHNGNRLALAQEHSPTYITMLNYICGVACSSSSSVPRVPGIHRQVRSIGLCKVGRVRHNNVDELTEVAS